MSIYDDETVVRALRQDPLSDAEKIVGESYKTNKDTMSLGFALHIRKNAAVERMLSSANDIYFGCPLDYFEGVLSELAERVLALPFEGRDGSQEKLSVWWGDGILYSYHTYGGKSVNSGKFYYNWRPQPDLDWSERCSCTSSGSMSKSGIWAGDHDIRKAVKLTLRQFRKYGELLPKWEVSPHLWLTHYRDHERDEGVGTFDHIKVLNAIHAERVAMLPAHVQSAIDAPKR